MQGRLQLTLALAGWLLYASVSHGVSLILFVLRHTLIYDVFVVFSANSFVVRTDLLLATGHGENSRDRKKDSDQFESQGAPQNRKRSRLVIAVQ